MKNNKKDPITDGINCDDKCPYLLDSKDPFCMDTLEPLNSFNGPIAQCLNEENTNNGE